jgi:hypothetical protein
MRNILLVAALVALGSVAGVAEAHTCNGKTQKF